MSNEIRQKTTGEILGQSCPMKCFKWKIRNISDLLQEVHHPIESSQFSFMDAEWHLGIFPIEERKHDNNRWIQLYLTKDDSVTEEHAITYILGIEKQDGTEACSFKYKSYFKNYQKGCGVYSFLTDTLLYDKSLIVPQDTVTFFCICIANISENLAAASQTAHPQGLERYCEDFERLLRTEEDSDIVLKVKTKEFRAHKTILRARSPVFRSMFRHDMQERKCSIVDIPDCDPDAFQNFLFYLYCGTLEEFPSSKVFDLYYVADKYDAPELKTKCLDFMKDNISVDTFCNVLAFALRHNESILLKYATVFFIGNETEIILSAEWLSFLKENPVEANELHIKASRIRIHKQESI